MSEKPLKLGEISEVVTSGSRGWAEYYSDHGALFLRMTNLPKNGIDLLLHDTKYVLLPNDSNEGKRTSIKSGDILISITAELGKIGYVEDENIGEAYVNQHVCLVRIKSEKANSKFIAYYLSAQKQRNLLNRLNDSGAKSGLNLSTINNFPLDIPDIASQGHAVRVLEKWDRAIAVTENLITVKQHQFEWLKTRLLLKNKNVKHWNTNTLGSYIEERKDKSTIPDQHPCLTSSRRGIFLQEEYFSKKVASKDNTGYKIIQNGDFTFRSMSDDGVFVFNKQDIVETGLISPAYGVFYPKENMDGDFLYYFLNSAAFRRALAREVQGGTRTALKLNALKKLDVELPDITEQKSIAHTLNTAQQEITLLQELAEQYRTQKRGLMQKLLSGQWRLNDKKEAA